MTRDSSHLEAAQPDRGRGHEATGKQTDGEAKSGLYGSPSFGTGRSGGADHPPGGSKRPWAQYRRGGASQSRGLSFPDRGHMSRYGLVSEKLGMFEPSTHFSGLPVGTGKRRASSPPLGLA